MGLRVRVCRVDEVPDGHMRAFGVPGLAVPVLVARRGDELFAVSSMCPHEDVSLAGGHLEGERVVCPGHGYAFELRSGTCTHDPSLVVPRYPITIIDDELWVDLL